MQILSPKKRLFLQIWNGFKLFLVLDCWFAITMVLVQSWPAKEIRPAEWQGSMAAAGIFFILSIGLLYSVFRTRRRLRQTATDSPTSSSHSAFYRMAPRFCDAIAGGAILGCGSQFLTEFGKRPDYSIGVVQWFTVFHFPISPLWAVRIKVQEQKTSLSIPMVFNIQQTTYLPESYLPLPKRLITSTYLYYYAFLLPAILLPPVAIELNWAWVTENFEGPKFWWIILGYLVWGIWLFASTDRRNHGLFHRKQF